MPSIFWPLLTWQLAAPLLIRVTLGAVLIHWAYREFKSGRSSAKIRIVSGLEGVVGILLVIGLWTQGAALVAAIVLATKLGGRIRSKAFLTDGVNYYLILLVLALSLLVTGAGFWAFDIQL